MKLPHSLKLIVFFLRIALGLDFFYLGWSSLFNPALENDLRARSLTSLYSWLSATGGAGTYLTAFEWAFLIVGVCLAIGLATRFASIVGIMLTLASYLPNVSHMTYTTLTATQFINDEIIIVLCLMILLFANAGRYLGMDGAFHFRASRQPK